MDKEKESIEEDIEDGNREEGFMNNDKEPKTKKKKDFVGELKNERWSGIIKLDDYDG
jgi:hypothetical protein